MEKRTSLFENGLIWFGAGVSIAEILTGTYFAALGFGRGLAAILVGHVIGCIMLFLAGVIGGKTRKSAMETVKDSFGSHGGQLFAILNVLQLVGWTAIMIYDGALAAGGIFTVGHWVWCLVIGALIIVWILIGITNLGKVNTVAMAALFILTLILFKIIFFGPSYSNKVSITFSSFLALGIILISVAKSSTDLFHILFGNILAVQDTDMFITMGVGAVILLLIWIFFKQLLITSFDELLAKAMGMPVNFYHYLLMVLLTLVSVTAMQSVGTILIVAMLITPAATAYLYANSLKSMIFLSSTFGATASVLGLFIGYSFNVAAGSSIVLTAASFFLISFFIAPKQRYLKLKNKHLLK